MTGCQRGFEAYNARHVASSPPGGFGPLGFPLLLYFTLARDPFGAVECLYLNPVKAGWVSRPEDGAWSSVHDSTGAVNDAPLTPRGLSVDRVLLPWPSAVK